MINAQLEHYVHIPFPEELSDDKWAEKWTNLLWIRKEEAKHNKLF